MAHLAVGLKTESGDNYTVLVEYRYDSDVVKYLKDIFDNEFSFISEVQVDSGISTEKDDEFESLIYEAVVEEQDL